MSDGIRIVALISGRGSNMVAIADAFRDSVDATLVAVLSNQPDAPGLGLAGARGIATDAINHRDFASREAFDAALADRIDDFQPDLVVLAGFMRILTPGFISRFQGRLLNIHPSLLPKYPGLATHERALADGEREHGATVHFVTDELDGGPGIVQARVPVLPDDDPDTLASRVLTREHQIFPLAIRWFAAGRLELAGNMVQLDGRALQAPIDFGGCEGKG